MQHHAHKYGLTFTSIFIDPLKNLMLFFGQDKDYYNCDLVTLLKGF